MRFADLIAPMPVADFMTAVCGERPLHIPAETGVQRKSLLSWKRMNELLAIQSHWTEGNIKLIMNSRPIYPHFYFKEVDTSAGRVKRADSALIDVFLATGASLVANAVEDISPEIRAVVAELGNQFSARAGANIYCSFMGVQAFASHCDLHDVFAVQCEGEKVWNIYRNRAIAPVETLEGDEAQAMIDRAKGEVMLQAHLKPGDLLYIPRGYYHDALATDTASLHVTFSVAPFSGRILFQLLEEAAMADSDFRAFLPDARVAGGKPLADRLELLGRKLADLIQSPALRLELATRQRQLAAVDHVFSLPNRSKLESFARTQKAASIEHPPECPILRVGPLTLALGDRLPVAEYILSRPGFSLQELFARYPHLDRQGISELVRHLERTGIVFSYVPEV